MEHVFLSDLIHLRFEYFFNRKLPVSIRKTSEKILLGYAFKVFDPAQIHMLTFMNTCFVFVFCHIILLILYTSCQVKPLLLRLYKKAPSSSRTEDQVYQKIKSLIGDDLLKVQMETCFYIQITTSGNILNSDFFFNEKKILTGHGSKSLCLESREKMLPVLEIHVLVNELMNPK